MAGTRSSRARFAPNLTAADKDKFVAIDIEIYLCRLEPGFLRIDLARVANPFTG